MGRNTLRGLESGMRSAFGWGIHLPRITSDYDRESHLVNILLKLVNIEMIRIFFRQSRRNRNQFPKATEHLGVAVGDGNQRWAQDIRRQNLRRVFWNLIRNVYLSND